MPQTWLGHHGLLDGLLAPVLPVGAVDLDDPDASSGDEASRVLASPTS